MINSAIISAINAGIEILKIYNDPKADFSIEKKEDNSPLTIADKKSHSVIENILTKTAIPILSEEGTTINYSERERWNQFWLIDPLDGTKEFIKKNDEFTVNIALIEKGKPVMGVIYVPVSKELYIGKVGKGAWKIVTSNPNITLNTIISKGQKLPISTDRKVYTVVGSRSHMSSKTKEYIDRLRKKHNQIDIISKGSSLKICMIAEGIADEYPRFGPTMEWDTAAGHAIANAANKKILKIDSELELEYNKKELHNPFFIVK